MYCASPDCKQKFSKGSPIKFFRFPRDKNRRLLWTLAVRQGSSCSKAKNWVPSEDNRLCGRHFITGKASQVKSHPDYVPSIFTPCSSKPQPFEVTNDELIQFFERREHKVICKSLISSLGKQNVPYSMSQGVKLESDELGNNVELLETDK
ncbi:THAP domain-containing protein 11 isoform X2 [Lepeophtheirus salmonis]|uniref:Putative LOC102231700 [Xiphosphorus maculatus] n=1 Tax=Lepeophtheirus salmonis TaxID=72036 RepID=A0A0K2TGX8_LEPSM|nr:THAP domain-containing protein 11-like isoform X2 [Lepeophtheirus salmonis]